MDISDFFHTSKEDPAYGMAFLIGKIVKGSGLKLTQDALLYEEKLDIENHKYNIGDILIVESTIDLFKLLEMDAERFEKGFKRKEDMFAFVATTPYLRSSEFTNLKKKYHPIFDEFREYLLSNDIETNGGNITHEYIDSFIELDFFTELLKLEEKGKLKKERVTKFNGRVILDFHPAFDKKLIGKAIRDFKFSFGTIESYVEFILGNSQEKIMSKFKETVQF